jgi:tetratricopeptide (TPR) repeat protein
MLLAEIYRETANLERADELQEQAERDAPDTPEAWYVRSFATLDLERALQCAEQAVKRGPSHLLAWCRLTYLRRQTGDPDGALQGADKLIELGENPELWAMFKGVTQATQGRFRDAIEDYARRGGAQVLSASAYLCMKEYKGAVALYDELVERVDKRRPPAVWVWVFYQRATVLWIVGRTEDALEDYRWFLSLRPGPSYAHARQYLILRELGRNQEAEDVLEGALRQVAAPRDANEAWLYQIFRCLDGQITPEKLVADARERHNPEWLCEAYYYAGEVCLLLDRPGKARKWFEKCVETELKFDPDTAPATPMSEYHLASWRLDALFTDVPASPPEKN